MVDYSEYKKAKGTKKCLMKKKLMFKNYKDSWFNNMIILKSQHRFKTDQHDVYTGKSNKIALSNNDDKRLQISDKITTYPYSINALKVIEIDMPSKYD